jgi:hypothetical protein
LLLFRACTTIRISYTKELLTLFRHKSSIRTIETQVGVLFSAGIRANNARSFLLLRVDVDAVSLEAAAGSFRVTLDDECFGLFEVWKALVVPAGLLEIVWLASSFRTAESVYSLTFVRQLPSPGLKLLMSPVMLPNVKSRSSTLELLGRSAVPALPW